MFHWAFVKTFKPAFKEWNHGTSQQIKILPQFTADSGLLTHRHERNLLVALIAGGACALWVEDRLPVHQESILVVAMSE